MFVAGLSLTLLAAGVITLFAIIELGLTGYVSNVFGEGSPDSINFLIFCSVWSLLVIAYLLLAPRFAPAPFFHRYAPPALLVVTTIFWFAGAIAAAAALGAPRCHGSVCRSWQAGIAFAWFIWAIFTALTGLELLELKKHHGPTTTHHPETTHV